MPPRAPVADAACSLGGLCVREGCARCRSLRGKEAFFFRGSSFVVPSAVDPAWPRCVCGLGLVRPRRPPGRRLAGTVAAPRWAHVGEITPSVFLVVGGGGSGRCLPLPLSPRPGQPSACGLRRPSPPLTSLASEPSVRPSFRLPSIFRARGPGFHGAPTLLRLSPWLDACPVSRRPRWRGLAPACSRSPDPARRVRGSGPPRRCASLPCLVGVGPLRPRTRSRAPPVARRLAWFRDAVGRPGMTR